jgi:UDP-N-acetylglucosamine diphosphorylase/glucosamine-1-phosphate N-acetyltransferase
MGALVYGPTSIGSNCRVGGEINNSVFHDYSNKAHGGFLGNSVIGSWCNLGADTTSSNLKNNYSEVSVWDNESKALAKSGRTFHGLIMGDHSKTAIHTSFNTGTVVGAFCNVFGANTPAKHIPSFTWGSADTHDIEKALDTARRVMKRRGVELSSEEEMNIRQMHKSSTFGI